jgi:hypothetical protein
MTRILLCILAIGCQAAASDLQRSAGKYAVTLRLPPDGLYAREEMEIELRIEDTSRVDPLLGATPVIRARVECTIDMPAMPRMPKVDEVAHAEGVPGEYGVHPTFAHGGDYVLHVAAAPPEDQPFQVEFALRVLDAEAARKHKPKPARFQMELAAAPKTPVAGKAAELKFVIRDREAPGSVYSTFERMHEKLLHLVIVRSDLAEFAHEHPELGPDGIFRLNYAFASGGEYHLFAQVAPKGAGAQVLMAKLRVSGKVTPATAPAAAEFAPVATGRMVTLRFPLPVADLELYLGAKGHLILIHKDALTFVHSHPDENITGGTELPFLARLPKPGIYHGWLQFQQQGKIMTRAFQMQAGAGE